MDGDVAKIILAGELDLRAAPRFAQEMADVRDARRLVLVVDNLSLLCPEGARVLILAKQKMDLGEDIFLVGASGQVREILAEDRFNEEITVVASYDDAIKA